MEITEEVGKDDFHVPLKRKRRRPPSGEGCFVLRGAGSGKVDHPLSQTIAVSLPVRGTLRHGMGRGIFPAANFLL